MRIICVDDPVMHYVSIVVCTTVVSRSERFRRAMQAVWVHTCEMEWSRSLNRYSALRLTSILHQQLSNMSLLTAPLLLLHLGNPSSALMI